MAAALDGLALSDRKRIRCSFPGLLPDGSVVPLQLSAIPSFAMYQLPTNLGEGGTTSVSGAIGAMFTTRCSGKNSNAVSFTLNS